MKKHFRVYFQVSSLILMSFLVWAIIQKPDLWWLLIVFSPLIAVGWYDSLQKKDNVRRNYPIVGTIKRIYVGERHVLVQEFQENNREGRPFNWLQRNIVNKRSDDKLLSIPYGGELDVQNEGYDWWLHSMLPLHVQKDDLRFPIGNEDCLQPYNASILNISGMSYGSISKNAVLALGEGAKIGGFALNTGEGGLTKWHLLPGCDLIFQFGTAYFGCRTKEGSFDPEKFKEIAIRPEVKMTEIKISQGAKPGYGAILPASKNTEEVSKIRGVPAYQTISSPGGHTAFSTPVELLEFVKQLRELSNGKPVGIKLCLGNRYEFISICKAMRATGIKPDYIVIDGSEGGTNAANIDSINYVGMPVELALPFVHDVLVGFDLKKHIRLIGSGKIISSFDVIKFMALGADGVNSARAMMFALGCTQALKCNTNECPTGVTTMEPDLVKGLVVKDKKVRVTNFHKNTVKGVKEMMASAGLSKTSQVKRSLISRRISPGKVATFEDIYPGMKPGALLQPPYPEQYKKLVALADSSTFLANKTLEEDL